MKYLLPPFVSLLFALSAGIISIVEPNLWPNGLHAVTTIGILFAVAYTGWGIMYSNGLKRALERAARDIESGATGFPGESEARPDDMPQIRFDGATIHQVTVIGRVEHLVIGSANEHQR